LKLNLQKADKNALTAIFLCLIFYIILPFLLMKFFPSAADALRKFRWTVAFPMLLIAGIMYFFAKDTFIRSRDFSNLPLCKLSLYSTGMLFVCGVVSFLWLKLLDVLKIPYTKDVPVEDFIRSCSEVELIAAGIFICILTPLFEEIIFRRIIYDGIKSHLPPVTSALICSMLFAALHGILFQLVPLCVLGLYFQFIYLKEEKLGASIYAHFFNNTIAFSVICIMKFIV
jgi:membrane protease YdiL (CAAX protease family)